MLQRLVAYLWGAGLVLLSAWPALREPPVDSYPLSSYPMFSERRGQPLIQRMVAVYRDSSRQPLPPRLVANAETLQAAATIRRAIAEGKLSMLMLCHEVASRVADDGDFSRVVRLEILQERYDPIEYFEQGRQALESQVLSGCRIHR